MKPKSRVLELDVIRAIAVLMVIIFHYTARFDEKFGPFEHNITWFKHGGVHLFFIFSGYLIYSSLLSSKNELEFITRRLLRLYPSYWICVIISFVTISYFGLEGREVSFKDFLLNLTMLQYALGVNSVDAVYWSLFYQLSFYFFMACSFRFIKNPYVHVYFFAWILLYIANSLYFNNSILYYLFSLKYSMLFLGGIYFNRLNKKKSLLNITMPFLTFLLFVLYSDDHLDNTQITIIGVSYLLIYLYAFQRLNLNFLKPVALLAPISFEWYLLHQNIGYIMLNFIYKYVWENPVMILIPMSITAAMAWVIYNYLGQPAANYLTGKLIRRTPEKPIVPVRGGNVNAVKRVITNTQIVPGAVPGSRNKSGMTNMTSVIPSIKTEITFQEGSQNEAGMTRLKDKTDDAGAGLTSTFPRL